KSVAQRRVSKDRPKKRSLRDGHQLQHMTVRIPEIDPAAAVPVVELTVVEAPGGAAVRNPRLLDARQDRVELGLAHVEGVVVAFKLGVVVKQQGQLLVDPHRREVVALPAVSQSKDAGEETGGGDLIARGHDRVIENNGHGTSSASGLCGAPR